MREIRRGIVELWPMKRDLERSVEHTLYMTEAAWVLTVLHHRMEKELLPAERAAGDMTAGVYGEVWTQYCELAKQLGFTEYTASPLDAHV